VKSNKRATDDSIQTSPSARTMLPPPPADASDMAVVATATSRDQSDPASVRDAHAITAAHDDAKSTAPAARESVRPTLPPQVENARSAILAAFARKAHEDDSSSRPTVRPSFRIARVALRPKAQQIVETVAPAAIKSEPAPSPTPAPKSVVPEAPITLPPAKASDARASVRAAFKNRGDASTVFATEGGNAATSNARSRDESAVVSTGANATTATPSSATRTADATPAADVARTAGAAALNATRADTAPASDVARRADATPATDAARTAGTTDSNATRAADATPAAGVAQVAPAARTEGPDPTRIAQAREAMLATLAKARSLIPSKSRKAARASEPTTETRTRSQATRTHEDAPAARSSSI
jgi:hypothetical protein